MKNRSFILPKTLHNQMLLVLGALLTLIAISVGAAAWEVNQAHLRIHNLTERQARMLRATTRFASLTEAVSTGTANLLLADEAGARMESFGTLQHNMDQIETLQSELLRDSVEPAILDLQERSQAYRTAVNVALALRQKENRDEQVFREGVERTVKQRRETGGLSADVSDLLAISRVLTGAEAGKIQCQEDAAVLRDARVRQLNRRETLRKYVAELRGLGTEMTSLAQESAAAAQRDYDASLAAHMRASRASVLRLLALLGIDLAAGYLLVRFLVQKQILNRIAIVSSWLRGEVTSSGTPSIPVRGGDEVASMARAVEALMEDQQQLVTAKRELEAASNAAQQANRLKSEFLANMSHEIRTPMNAILGYTQLMGRDPSLSKEQLARLEPIDRAGEHLLALINDILEMSKIEAGKITYTPSPLDLHALLRDLVGIYSTTARTKGVALTLDQSPELPRHIVTDGGKLRQSLVNLIGNAVKFTKVGSVTVLAGAERGDDGKFTLRFDVTDTGPGLTEEEINTLFSPFVQSTAGLTMGGTGLGLAISRQYARLLGGDITVESEPGHGATFILTVRITLAEESIVAEHIAKRCVLRLAEGHPPIRVLIVDDLRVNCDLLDALLRPMGFETRLASNGAEALSIFGDWKPEAVLMDMRMPVMDGYEACRRIRATPDGRAAFILAVTATAFLEDTAAVLAAGVDAVMRKPFKEDELFAILGERLGLRYIYTDQAEEPYEEVADSLQIPDATGSEILRACTEADYDRLLEICEQLEAGGDAAAAKTARNRVMHFDYEGLSQLVIHSAGGNQPENAADRSFEAEHEHAN